MTNPLITKPGQYRVAVLGRAGHSEVVSYMHTERRYWVDCATHGPTNPETTERRTPGWGLETFVDVVMTGDQPAANCGVCGALARLRRVAQRLPRDGRHTECGSACLAGRVSCDCRCRGRCHGAGECACGTAHAEVLAGRRAAR